jgi:hypothetical protein
MNDEGHHPSKTKIFLKCTTKSPIQHGQIVKNIEVGEDSTSGIKSP